jgi:hypothetical protein
MKAYKYYMEIKEDGKLEVPKLPVKKGEKVEVIILPLAEEDNYDLLSAAESSLSFWDNEIDDQVWNNV